MDQRRILIIAGAVVLALIAVFLANSWFTGYEREQERIAAEQQLVRIAVARRDIPFGTPLTNDNVRMANWPRQSMPAGSYEDAQRLLSDNNVAIRPIVAGEPILRSRISERAILSANIPDNMRAVTVPVSAVTGVAGFVVPGDVVDVFLTRQIPGDGAGGDDKMTSVLLENVQVLAVDRRSSERSTTVKVSKTATLQVDQQGAQKLALAVEVGKLSLALRNVEDQLMGSTTTVTSRDLGGRGYFIPDRSRRAAAPPQSRAAPAQFTSVAPSEPAPPRGPSMTVYRGTERRNVPVERYGY